MDRTITIERVTTTVDDFGTPISGWATVATIRAQRIQATTEEFMRSFGASTETAVIFRIRHMDGLTLADRVKEGSAVFDLKEIKELGRREGLELRTVATGG
ncbi:head-tail adaptor protein [Sphingobium jiangsuense]|uniref:head-tail adaptor protein n=1 Tax=Sphingobium jiangsuense TaxID=870476 RepID=UPI001CB6C4B4|nr:head-tail adaptor protein [Sphingobium jiangsuense]